MSKAYEIFLINEVNFSLEWFLGISRAFRLLVEDKII
jgi:hypothetical protein